MKLPNNMIPPHKYSVDDSGFHYKSYVIESTE